MFLSAAVNACVAGLKKNIKDTVVLKNELKNVDQEQEKNKLEQVKNLITLYKNLDSKLSTVIGCLEKTIDNLSNGGYILDGVPYKKKELKEIISNLMAARNQIGFATLNLGYRQQELEKNIQKLGG